MRYEIKSHFTNWHEVNKETYENYKKFIINNCMMKDNIQKAVQNHCRRVVD